MWDPAATFPAVWPSSAAAARSVDAGSPRLAPKPTYAHLTPTGALLIDHLYELFTIADGLARTASRWVAARSQLIKDVAMLLLAELTVVLILCPAALAIWADTRYPNLRPTGIRRT